MPAVTLYRDAILELRAQGKTWAHIGSTFGCSRATVARFIRGGGASKTVHAHRPKPPKMGKTTPISQVELWARHPKPVTLSPALVALCREELARHGATCLMVSEKGAVVL